MKIFAICSFLCLSLYAGAQTVNKTALLAKSDSLFAKGVELYKTGKFNAAIPLFTESDKIDKTVLDSTSNRRDYSVMWLARCYYKLGDTIKAKECSADYYLVEPVDRRLTVKSDSLSAIGDSYYRKGDNRQALSYFQQCGEIEKKVVGEKQIWWYANTLSNCAWCYNELNDTTNALNYFLSSLKIDSCSYGLNSKQYMDELINIANVYIRHQLSNRYEKYLDYGLKAYNIANNLKDDFIKKSIADTIALCYNCLGLNKSGIEERSYYEKSLQYLAFADPADSNVIALKETVRSNIVISFSNEANEQNNKGNFAEAIHLGTEALNIQERILGKENAAYARLLSSLSDYNFNSGKNTEALKLETEALSIRGKLFGTNCPDYAYSLNNLARYNFSLGKIKDAIQLGNEALQIIELKCGKNHPDYATMLDNLSNYYSGLGNYQEAVRIGTEALDIRGKIFGHNSSDYAYSLNNLAIFYSSFGNYKKAIQLGTEALDIFERIYGKNHPVYATSLGCLASYYSSLGNYPEAIHLESESLNIREKILGKEHPDYAGSLSCLAVYNSEIGNYNEALRLETEALNISEKRLGKNHPAYASSVSNIANYYWELGNYPEAIRLGTEALDIQGKVLGKEHPVYAISLNRLANYNWELGNYQEAIRLGTKALDIQGKVLGKEHPDYATSLNNLANYYTSIGNWEAAIRLGMEALHIREKLYGKDHPLYTNTLSNLAAAYNVQGNYKNAVQLEMESSQIKEKILGKNHPDYVISLGNLAQYQYNSKNYLEAIQLASQALIIREKIIGKYHPDYAKTLNNLAQYYSQLGKGQEALKFGTEALTLREKVLGKKHPEYAVSLKNLAGYYIKNNDFKGAKPLLESYSDIVTNLIRTNFSWLTQNERALYWDQYKNDYLNLIPKYDYTVRTDTAYTKMDYNAQLLAKGLLLNSEIDFRNLIQKQENNKAVIAKYEEWREMKVQINKLYEKSDSATMAYRKTRETKADSLERVLLHDCKAFGDYTRNLSIQWQDVQAKLGQTDVAIEYTSFATGKDSTMYCALLLKKSMASPQLVPLFEKKELDNLTLSPYCTFKVAIGSDLKEYHELIYNSKNLGQLVWSKVLPYLNGVQNVYFSPSGVFHQLGIENLPLADGKPFSEHYEAYRLSSTRELATTNTVSSSNKADLYGGLQYNEEPQHMEEMSHRQRRDVELSDNLALAFGDSLSMYQRAKIFYGANADSSQSSRAALEVNELPYTREEVMDINSKLSKSGNAKKLIQTKIFSGTEGNEESFKALSGTHPSIIHIATHGFFLPQTQAEEFNDKRTFLMGFKEQQQRAEVDFSLSRAGLLMAGARKAWMGDAIPDSIDDGILTAREIAHLDLRGTDLVVLSACETGLGDVTGEGVFGLQRGFKKAGVNTLVMSLWKVDDKATQMMMTQFYANLMKGQAKRTAFLNAQKYLKDYSIQEKYETRITPEMSQGQKEALQKQQGEIEIIHPYASPQFWAAFIMLDGIK